jgi:hypothetical protein
MIDPIINSIWIKSMDPHSVCHELKICPKEYFKRNISQEISNIVKDKPDKVW